MNRYRGFKIGDRVMIDEEKYKKRGRRYGWPVFLHEQIYGEIVEICPNTDGGGGVRFGVKLDLRDSRFHSCYGRADVGTGWFFDFCVAISHEGERISDRELMDFLNISQKEEEWNVK